MTTVTASALPETITPRIRSRLRRFLEWRRPVGRPDTHRHTRVHRSQMAKAHVLLRTRSGEAHTRCSRAADKTQLAVTSGQKTYTSADRSQRFSTQGEGGWESAHAGTRAHARESIAGKSPARSLGSLERCALCKPAVSLALCSVPGPTGVTPLSARNRWSRELSHGPGVDSRVYAALALPSRSPTALTYPPRTHSQQPRHV